MGEQYRIAFRGEVADGHSLDDVRGKFAARFRKDPAAVDRLFSGKVITLAKGLDWDRANAAISKLESYGAVVYLIDGNGKPVTAAPANDPSAEETPLMETGKVAAAVETASDETDPYDLTATAKVRHLTQITEKCEAPPRSKKELRKTRWRYRFDTFMAKGGG